MKLIKYLAVVTVFVCPFVYADGVKCNELSISLVSDSATVAYRGGILFQDALTLKGEEKLQSIMSMIRKDMSSNCVEEAPRVAVTPQEFQNLGRLGKLLSIAGFSSFEVVMPQKSNGSISKEKVIRAIKGK